MTQQLQHRIDQYKAEYWLVDYGASGRQSLVAQGPVSQLAKTAPHDCHVPGCPGPENKRKLATFPELLAACEGLLKVYLMAKDLYPSGSHALEDALAKARAAIVLATKEVEA